MKVRYILITVAVALGLQGCRDWDDHYGVDTCPERAEKTLWEKISNDSNLTNFATLLQKVGYDQALDGNQSYTVWAPKNGTYDFEKYNAMSDSLLKAEFIQNHIARGYHRATGDISERVHLLNKKTMLFTGSDNFSIGNLPLDSINILSKNGIMHYMKDMIDFRPNFYEFFLRNRGNDTFDTETLGNIFQSNMKKEIDKENSIEGPMKDGDITYLDTVYVESNKMFNNLNAYLSDEDSTYTMIIPSNSVWKDTYNRAVTFFNFPTKVEPFTVSNNETTGKLEYKPAPAVSIEADSLKDLYATVNILSSLVYSNTTNPVLKNGNKPSYNTPDSIRTTSESVICNVVNYMSENSSLVNDAAELFDDTERQTLSNGYAWLAKENLNIKSWNAWSPIIHLRAQNSKYQAATDNVSLTQNIAVGSTERNPNVQGSLHATSYYQVTPSLNSSPNVFFYIPRAWSTSYAVYLTMVPANITNEEAEVTTQKIQIRTLDHTNEGKAPSNEKNPTPLKKDFGNNTNLAATTFDYGTQESAKILSKFVGVYNPKICYFGLNTETPSYPVFRLNCSTRGSVLRIAGITLVPQDVVEYYKEKGMLSGEDGKEYTGDMPEIFWNLNRITY